MISAKEMAQAVLKQLWEGKEVPPRPADYIPAQSARVPIGEKQVCSAFYCPREALTWTLKHFHSRFLQFTAEDLWNAVPAGHTFAPWPNIELPVGVLTTGSAEYEGVGIRVVVMEWEVRPGDEVPKEWVRYGPFYSVAQDALIEAPLSLIVRLDARIVKTWK